MRSTNIRISDTELQKIHEIKEHLKKATKHDINTGEAIDLLCDIGLRFIKDGHDLAKIHGLCKYSKDYSIDNTGTDQAKLGRLF